MRRLLNLELKRVVSARSTWILLVFLILVSAVMAYFPISFENTYQVDEHGNARELTGKEAISYQKELEKEISGEVTEEKVRKAILAFQECYREYGAIFPPDVPTEVYADKILPVYPILDIAADMLAPEDIAIYNMTDADIANSIQYGKEGKDYTLDGDIVQMKPQVNIMQSYFGYEYTNQMITHSTTVMAADKLKYTEAFHKSYGKEIPDGFRFDPAPVLEQIVATNLVFDGMDGTETARKIINLEIDDVEQVIASITEELKQAGIDEVTAEANRQLEAWRAGNS